MSYRADPFEVLWAQHRANMLCGFRNFVNWHVVPMRSILGTHTWSHIKLLDCCMSHFTWGLQAVDALVLTQPQLLTCPHELLHLEHSWWLQPVWVVSILSKCLSLSIWSCGALLYWNILKFFYQVIASLQYWFLRKSLKQLNLLPNFCQNSLLSRTIKKLFITKGIELPPPMDVLCNWRW